MSGVPTFACFWMVCRKPNGPGAKTEPRQRYSRHQDAVDAAQKLARDNDHPLLVLEAVEIYHPSDARQGGLF